MSRSAVLAGLLAASMAAAEGPFRFERDVIPAGPGPSVLAVDAQLLVGASRLRYDIAGKGVASTPVWKGGLEDLRLYTLSGSERPYLLLPPPPPGESWEPSTIQRVPATKAASGFEAELKAPRLVGRLRLEGLPAPFMKRFRLEGSGDRARWTVLIAEGTLFDLPDEKLRLVEAAFPPGEFRYLRLIWDDRMSARLPLPRGAEFRLEAKDAPAVRAVTPIPFTRIGSEPGKSRFHLRLPGAHFPVVSIQLVVSPGNLLRSARITEPRLSEGEVRPHLLGESTLRQATRQDVTASELRIPIAFPSEPDLDLVVDDADNPPLDLLEAEAVLAPLPAIWFESPSREPLVARFGNQALAAPRYDLEVLRDSARLAPAREARWGPVRALAPGVTPAPDSPVAEFGAAVSREEFGFSRPILSVKPGLNALPLDAAVLAHGTLASLRIVGDGGRQVPYLLEKREEPLTLDLESPERLAETGSSSRVSSYRVRLPFRGLPASRLVLATPARVFERAVSVRATREGEGGREKRVETVARAAWRHADPDREATSLVLELPPLDVSELNVTIDEGDNSPLAISSWRLLLPSYRLRFFAASEAERGLLYGAASLGAPRYDLALLAPRLVGVAAHDVSLGPETAQAPTAKRALDRKLFWGALIAAGAALLVLLGRLLRPGAPPASPAP